MSSKVQTWIRSDESDLAEELRYRNLAHADAVQPRANPKSTAYSKYVKRTADIVISGMALIATLPINTVLAVVTLKDVGQPIFYCQQRTGWSIIGQKSGAARGMAARPALSALEAWRLRHPYARLGVAA